MASRTVLSVKSNRRSAIRTGGLLAAAAGLSAAKVSAQDDATPETEGAEEHTQVGSYCVIRSYTLQEEADVNGLIDIVGGGFVDIISEVDGFEQYFVVYNEESRSWTAISVYADKAGAEESTKDATDYVAENDIASYLMDPTPTIVEGTLVVAAESDHEGH